MTQKTAVILFNLGGPDSSAAIRPFLFNFFTDPSIVRLPFFLRWPLAAWIALRRSKREAGASYGLLGGRSPLLENTQAQAKALETALGPDYGVFVCMRYWHPLAPEVAAQVKMYAPDSIVLLPLYPQYSTTTTQSSLRVWRQAAKQAGLTAPWTLVKDYPRDPGFIAAAASAIRPLLMQAQTETGKKPRLLFSAHGLPESIIRAGDPYAAQCAQSAQAVAAALELPEADWVLCYQSRVGRQKWLGPSTESEIRRAGAGGVPLVIHPIAFTQEHVETLVELDIEYRHVAQTCGVPRFYRAATPGTDPAFIDGLAGLARART